MAQSSKTKIIKNYEKLTSEELEQIKLVYPKGFRKHLVEYTGMDGKKRKGLPIETVDKYYLIRMTTEEAIYVIAEDEDYDDNGRLKPKVRAKLADKHDDIDFLDEYNSNDDNDYGDEDGAQDINIEELDEDLEDLDGDT